MFGMQFGFEYFWWGYLVMIFIGALFIYLGIAKDYEPLLLVPIGFGIILINLPLGGLMDYKLDYTAPEDGIITQIAPLNMEVSEGSVLYTIVPAGQPATNQMVTKVEVTQLQGAYVSNVGTSNGQTLQVGDTVRAGQVIATIYTTRPPPVADQMIPVGLISRFFNYGIVWEIIPCLIFLGLGALTDFGPLIASPKSLLLGAAAQFGVYFVFFSALLLGHFFPGIFHFGLKEAASISIIGGADGPTTIYLTQKLAPWLLGTNAVAAYSYMAMVPIIQPPIIRMLCTKEEIGRYMKPQLRKVSRLERTLFPVIAAILIIIFVPKIAPLIGMFMFGNLLREVPGTQRLAKTASESFIDIVTMILGITIGCFMSAESFLRPETIAVFVLGIIAFSVATAGGVIAGKVMAKFSKEPFNPIIGAAGVSAVPMSARVVQKMSQQANPKSFLLMHAMGPNVAGVIGTAIAAGMFMGLIH
jgi:carboxybiotin decarboxylase